tara:strand:+ start:1904 stop:2557 length:654 start_codon:yes stop_codon:yes gene_type:complete
MEIIARVVAFLLIIILLPLLILISIISLFHQGSPVIFKQSRIGYNYNQFHIYKFRTMRNENSGELITKYNDDRITSFGRILRKTKIDEIPQIFNILKGEMRFIGPRPELPEYFIKENFRFLEKIKPGISDYASIIFRDEDEILKRIGGDNPYAELLPIKLQLADYYSRKKSFLLDLRLIIITIIAIIFPKFASNSFLIPSLIIEIPSIKAFLNRYYY